MDKEKYSISFETISFAGNSKSEAMEAMRCARKFEFKKAIEHLDKAKEFMNQAHQIQTNMIVQESRGESVEVNVILVHAQDHLVMAQMMYDMAEEIIMIYRNIEEVKGE